MDWRAVPWREVSFVRWTSGLWIGGVDHGWRSRPPIQDWIQCPKFGFWDDLLGPGMKVWDPDVGLATGMVIWAPVRGLGTEGVLGPGMEVCVPKVLDWNGGLHP